MTYNTDPRKPLRGKARQAFLAMYGYTCHECRLPITDDLWDDEHIIPRELVAPGTWADDIANRAPIHRGKCHKIKTARDRKLIAKSNRVRQKHGIDPVRRKPKPKMKGQGFPKGGPKQPIPSRKFQKRRN